MIENKINYVVLSAVFLSICAGCAATSKNQAITHTGVPVEIDLFTMSQCPYGVKAENIVDDLTGIFGDRISINLYYIAEKKIGDDGKPLFRSLQGSSEVEEDVRQLVIAKYYPEKFPKYLRYRNRAIKRGDWRGCARLAGIDPEFIWKKMEAGEGAQLLARNLEEQEKGEKWLIEGEEWIAPRASPTIYLNGELYQGPVTVPSLAAAINTAIGDRDLQLDGIPECFSDRDCLREGKIGRCRKPGTKEAWCEFTDPVPLDLICLNPEAYSGANETFLKGLKHSLPALTVREVEADSSEGKELIEALEIDFLPAYLFDDSIEEAENFDSLLRNNAIEKRGGYYQMVFNKLREGMFLDRKWQPGELDVYVMSQCPFGPDAYLQLVEAKEEGWIPPEIKINLYYIAEAKLDPDDKSIEFSSYHGTAEAEEDMRQLCVAEYYPEKFSEYVKLRNENIKSTLWEKPALAAGVDPARIIACVYRKGKELLLKNAHKAQKLGITSSPTFLWENEYVFFNPERIKELPGFEGVDIKLTGSCN